MNITNPAHPLNPINPANPANPASPLNANNSNSSSSYSDMPFWLEYGLTIFMILVIIGCIAGLIYIAIDYYKNIK